MLALAARDKCSAMCVFICARHQCSHVSYLSYFSFTINAPPALLAQRSAIHHPLTSLLRVRLPSSPPLFLFWKKCTEDNSLSVKRILGKPHIRIDALVSRSPGYFFWCDLGLEATFFAPPRLVPLVERSVLLSSFVSLDLVLGNSQWSIASLTATMTDFRSSTRPMRGNRDRLILMKYGDSLVVDVSNQLYFYHERNAATASVVQRWVMALIIIYLKLSVTLEWY